MPLSINTNICVDSGAAFFLTSNQALETAYERLATGKRINSSVDDAAGLAIGTELTSRVRGLNQAVRNVNDGISMLQIAEGAFDEVTTFCSVYAIWLFREPMTRWVPTRSAT